MADPLVRRGAVSSLVFARVVYAVNWLNIGAIYVLVEPSLGVGTSGLGTLTAAFYLGLGLTQIPGGVMAAKWGAKRVVVAGVLVSSFAVLGTSACTTLTQFALLRFAVGAGMAMVFAPAVVLVSRHMGDRTGPGVGLFNAAYDFGGVIGLFGWVVLASEYGWRESLLLAGFLGILTAVLVFRLVPNDPGGLEFSVDRSALGAIIANRQLVLIGFVTLGVAVGNVLVSSFMIVYVEKSLHYPIVAAGLVGSMVVVLPIFTAIWAGRMYEKATEPKTVLLLVLVWSGLALLMCGYPSIYTALASSVLAGVVAGFGFTFAFSAAKDVNPAGARYDGLAIAWVNAIQLTGAFFPPLLYTYFVDTHGYSVAWEASALLCMIFVVPLLLMARRPRG